MKPERIGITTVDLGLYEWIVILKTGMQAVQRTYAFANFEQATQFVAEIGEIAEEKQLFPHICIGTAVAEAIPTLVEVTIADPDLKLGHLYMAQDIEIAFFAQMEAAGAIETPAVDV